MSGTLGSVPKKVSLGVKRKRRTRRTQSGSEGESSTAPSPKVATARRGGKTSATFVAPAKAAEFAAEKRAAAEQSAEDEVAVLASKIAGVSAPSSVEEAVQRALDGADIVHKVATKSRNLKGTFQRHLKAAATAMVGSVECLAGQVKTLQAQMAVLQKQMLQLHSPAVVTLDNATGESRDSLVKYIDARIAGIQDRLLPEPNYRARVSGGPPNLAAVVSKPAPVRPSSGVTKAAKAAEAFPPLPTPRGPPRPSPRQRLAAPAPPTPIRTPGPSTAAIGNEGWQRVENLGKARRKRQRKAAREASNLPSGQSGPAKQNGAGKRRRRRNRLRAPKTAAVVVTLLPEAAERGLTYKAILEKARRDVGDVQLPKDGVRVRHAHTGARILEFPGAEGDKAADAVAAKMRSLFPGTDEVKISRPVKCAEMRITGLDDSVSTEDVQSAICGRTGCSVDAVRVGTIRPGPGGVGAVWARCPVVAAKQLADAGRILVGWSSARVQVLDPRPMRCYKCGEAGHARIKCPSPVDRSDSCYRCGVAGHIASACKAPPQVTEAARPGRSGGGNKTPATQPKIGSGPSTRAASNSARPPSRVEEEMSA